jgi:hypothetical protein
VGELHSSGAEFFHAPALATFLLQAAQDGVDSRTTPIMWRVLRAGSLARLGKTPGFGMTP